MGRGLWSPEEDDKLRQYILNNGYQCWSDVPRNTDCKGGGKSCRLRWTNYLRPGLRRSKFSADEIKHVVELHEIYGNRWSKIASYIEGRTDNDVKNLWNSQIRRHLSRLKNQKQILPNKLNLNHSINATNPINAINPINATPNYSSTLQDIKMDEHALITDHILMQPISKPMIFPFRLDSDNNCTSGIISQGESYPFEHIEKLLFSEANFNSMHDLGLNNNNQMEFDSQIEGGFSKTLLSVEDGIPELETDQESTNTHNQDPEVQALINHMSPWYNQDQKMELIGYDETLMSVINEGKISSTSCDYENILNNYHVQPPPPLFNPQFSYTTDTINMHDCAIFQVDNENMYLSDENQFFRP